MIYNTFEEQQLEDCSKYHVVLQTQNSYDEEKLQERIESTGKVKYFFACALQLALVGWGNNSYGYAEVDGEKIDIAKFITENGGFIGSDLGSKLEPNDITPKRIIRVFRWQISSWMKKNRVEGFLQRKYGNRSTRKHGHVLFPMAEHLVVTEEEALALKEVYEKLDSATNSKFVERINRVLAVRNLL